MKVRTRFAPSPTGSLHLGGARTALFNWLFARRHNGTFILRIEDTDVARSTQESALGIIESLTWLGLDWDEGPYFQSERLDIYQDHLKKLIDKKLIYPAFETKAELDALRQKAMDEKRNPVYDRAALKLSADEVQARMDNGDEFVWRFKVEEGVTEVPELLMADGDYTVRHETIGDFVITRPGTKDKPGMPLYNFVCAVDDALMDITHVIRGVEHLPNTAKQILLYKGFGYSIPQFVHLPLIMKAGKKMSKRDIDAGSFPVSILERRDLGYLPAATLNHLVLLGWAAEDGVELLQLERLKKEFDLDRLSKANANFDESKYAFLNSHYIKNMENKELVDLVTPFFQKYNEKFKELDANQLTKLAMIGKNRAKTLADFPNETTFIFADYAKYDEKGVQKFFKNEGIDAVKTLQKTQVALEKMDAIDIEKLNSMLETNVKELDIPFSKYGPVIRLALTGSMTSPALAEMIDVLGKDETLKRLQAAIDFCSK